MNWFLAIILSVLFSHCAFRSRTLIDCGKGSHGSGVIMKRALDCQHSLGVGRLR